MIVVYVAFILPAAFAESSALYRLAQLSSGANNIFSVTSYQSENRACLIRQLGAQIAHMLVCKIDASLEQKN